MDNIYESSNKINKIYGKLGYFDQYGGSLFFFILLIILLFLVHSYFIVMKTIQPIKQNWSVERCNPKVMPFAGIINKPDDKSITEFTAENFNYCLNNIQTSITGHLIEPITYLTYSLTEVFVDLQKGMQFLRNIMANIRNSIGTIAGDIMGRIANIIVPLQQIIIAVRDIMGKIQGTIVAGLYTVLSVYYILKSLLGAIAELTIILLVSLVALIATTWIISFFWPPFIAYAISLTVLFISIAIPLAVIMVFISDVLHIQVNGAIPVAPGRPVGGSCFDKNTKLKMNGGTIKTISEISVGEKLENGDLITAIMKLDARESTMYDLDGILVSGTHSVYHEGKWVFISEHPCAMKVSDYSEPVIYCLNTSSKRIIIEGFLFMDWDELTDDDMSELMKRIRGKETIDIHKNLDSGFSEDTEIKMKNNAAKKIKDVGVGEILSNGSIVTGIVEINGEELKQHYFDLGNNKPPISGTNLHLTNPLDGTKKFSKHEEKKLFHLITNSGIFLIEKVSFQHYNSSVELFLEKYNENLLSVKYV